MAPAGMTYDFHRRDNFGPFITTHAPDEVPDYTNSIQQFIGLEGRFSGNLDLAAFFDRLVDEGHIDPSYCVMIVEFRNEVVEGSCETWLRGYDVTVRSVSE